MTRMQVAVVAITVALNALDGFDVLSISLAAAPIRDEFGIGPAVTGLLLSMELVGMAVGSIFLGRYADKWGRRPMMLFCLALMTAGMFMVTTPPGIMAQSLKSMTDSMGLLQNWPIELVHISIWRIITGLGIGGMLASINAVVAEYSSSKHKHMNVALMSIGYPIGASLGGFVASALLAEYTWRSVFLLGFGMTLVMIPIVFFFVPETVAWTVRHQKPGALERVNSTLKKMGHATVSALPDVTGEISREAKGNIFSPKLIRTTAIVTIAYFCHIMTFYFILKWTGVIVADRGFDASQAGNVLSWINVGGAAGGALLGFLTLRYDLKRLTIGAMIMSTILVAVYGSVGSDLVQMTLICIACGFFINAAINGMYAIFAHSYPTQMRAAGTGFAIGVGRGGSLLAPIAAGLMFEGGIGVPVVAVVMGCGSLLAAIALFFLKLDPEPPEAIEAEKATEMPPGRLSESAA
ncbi:MAG TPA: MFS transporter [Gammaproteobacteria bacterium]|nr:MFS transporter [Gammaproteobacteria bacterium]